MNKRTYLMLGGTFLPATALALAAMIYTKTDYKSGIVLGAFAIGAAIGGYYTAQLLKENQ